MTIEVTAPSAAVEPHASNLTDRLVNSIDFDDFSLDDNPDTPETPPDSTLDDSAFDDDDDADGTIPDDDEEPTKPETPKGKPVPKPEPEPKPKARALLPPDKGTQDKPFSVNDLPADAFVKLKIDGKEQTLTMRELADGAIMKRTFDTTMSKTKQAIADAERIAQTHIAERVKLRGDVDAFLGNAQRMFKYMLDRDPDVMLELGALIGTQYGEWQTDPTARQRHDYARQQRQLQAERQRVDRERQEWEQQRTRAQGAESARQKWEPVYREAMKEAGFPKATPEFQDTLKTLIAQASRRVGGDIDAPTFKALVKRAAKIAASETVDQRTPPAAPPARERAPSTPARRGGKDWDSMSHAQKMRDPEWILSRSRVR